MSKPSGCCAPARMQAAAPLPAKSKGGGGLRVIQVPAPAAGDTAQTPAPAQSPTAAPMIELAGGTFLMGTKDPDMWPTDGEGPVREVMVRPFRIDACAVSNRQFGEFIRATGYRTEAEEFGWSYVFHLHVPPALRRGAKPAHVPGLEWWNAVNGARWDQPLGPGSTLAGRQSHPVVHVSWRDAREYSKWVGKRLPTEAEWEFAARGGLEQKRYPWGDDLAPGGKHHCNIWQGEFPKRDSGADGFRGTCPVDAFAPNGYGLYNVSGNVWEWCADWFSPEYPLMGIRDNPTGPPFGDRRVTRGGSFLCHESYCNRYRVSARTGNTPDTSSANTGFRCAADA